MLRRTRHQYYRSGQDTQAAERPHQKRQGRAATEVRTRTGAGAQNAYVSTHHVHHQPIRRSELIAHSTTTERQSNYDKGTGQRCGHPD